MPVGVIHSSRDEYVPLSEVHQVSKSRAAERLWIVTAADHRFSDNVPEFDRALLEAIAWIAEVRPRGAK